MRSRKAERHERQCDTSDGSYNMDLMSKTGMSVCGMRRFWTATSSPMSIRQSAISDKLAASLNIFTDN